MTEVTAPVRAPAVAVTLGVAAALVGSLAVGCGGSRVGQIASALPGASVMASPLGLQPIAGALPTLVPRGSGLPLLNQQPVSGADPKDAIRAAYQAWMNDLSGLFENLSPVWVHAISEVATPAMTRAAQQAAGAIQQAHDHGVGTLVDGHRVISIKGSTASLSDCLDELHWYVVEDANNTPDPSVSRGYFVGSASFVLTGGQWFVSEWNSHPKRCSP